MSHHRQRPQNRRSSHASNEATAAPDHPDPLPYKQPNDRHPMSPSNILHLQRTIGNRATQKWIAQQTAQQNTVATHAKKQATIQRAPPDGGSSVGDAAGVSSGELAWEIFSPVALSAVRTLGPGILGASRAGEHLKKVVEVASKVEGSSTKVEKYGSKVKEFTKDAGSERKFNMKSLGKIYAHFNSVPDAWEIDGEALIEEAAQVVNAEMFTNAISAVQKLRTFEVVVEDSKKMRSPYTQMISNLTDCKIRIQASFDALGVLEDALMDVASIGINPTYQVWAFATAQQVAGYRRDVGRIISTIDNKRKGYEESIAASEAMEAYMSGNAGRKTLATNYRDPKSPDCLARIQAALPLIISDPDNIYDHVLTYSECTFETILDSLDFLPINDSDGFFAVTEGLRDAYPDRDGEISAKENRYVEGVYLSYELDKLRPTLNNYEAFSQSLAMNFIWKEYYHFWTDDPRSLLSNYRFTYLFQIKEMQEKVQMLPIALIFFDMASSM